MRQVILDLETTGLDPAQGHRIVEFAGLEMVHRVLTGADYHTHVNPEREIEQEALLVHGITTEFLATKPTFDKVAHQIIKFIHGAELIIHNAAFDVGFLNIEFKQLDMDPVEKICPSIIDTLQLAREMFPGKRNNLDALCDRFNIDRSDRMLHGAKKDCSLLAKIYLLLTRGQESLTMHVEAQGYIKAFSSILKVDKSALVLQKATEAENALHEAYLNQLGEKCLWRQYHEGNSS